MAIILKIPENVLFRHKIGSTLKLCFIVAWKQRISLQEKAICSFSEPIAFSTLQISVILSSSHKAVFSHPQKEKASFSMC